MKTLADVAVDDVRARINEAVLDATRGYTESEIRRLVKEHLERGIKQGVAVLLGFQVESNGKWSVDHCNGRSGESAAGTFIRKYAEEGVLAFLKELCVNIPEPDPTMRESIAKSYKETFARHAQDAARRIAQADAENYVKRMIGEDDSFNDAKKLAAERERKELEEAAKAAGVDMEAVLAVRDVLQRRKGVTS